MKLTTTKCPECLSLWTANLDEILSNQHKCPSCKPRVQSNPDKDLIDWIEQAPNPRLDRVVNAWRRCEGGVSLRSNIRHCMKSPTAGNLIRVIKLGYRILAGSPIPVVRGSMVERFDSEKGIWIHVGTVHPNDAYQFSTNLLDKSKK